MLFTILGALTGLAGPIAQITGQLKDKQVALRKADSEDEKNRLQAEMEALHDRRSVLIAEAGSRLNAIVRAIAASPAIAVTWKLMIWDKVIGSLVGCSQAVRGTCASFTTDPLDANQWKIIGMVYGFYFLCELGLGVAKIIKR